MDFGFENEPTLESSIIPFCQFFNPPKSGKGNMGIGIKPEQAELAGFKPDSSFKKVEHYFGEQQTEVFLASAPRLLVLNKSKQLYMKSRNEGSYTEKFNLNQYTENKANYKIWGYAVVMFLSQDNKFLSELPFRIKSNGVAGISFMECWNGGKTNTPNLFAHLFKQYQQVTGKKLEPISFKSHMIYEPTFERKMVGKGNNQSPVCFTTDFKKYELQDGLISRSQEIVDFVELTKSWGEPSTILREYSENIDDNLASKTDSDGVVHDTELEQELAKLDEANSDAIPF